MKLTIIILLMALVQVSASSLAQNINLQVKKAPLEEVLNELTRQSSFHFFYEFQLLGKAHPVTISVVNQPLLLVLKECFADQPLIFVLEGNDVIIKTRPAEKT
ncbi:MAG: TonB-dependent receptor plug, partial [Segetibacter sp.]|nr:TonB-dependent receptor plug [Segetibacter sp.]